FVHADSTAQSWYLAQPSPIAFGTGKTTSIGGTPSITWTGTPSIAANQFQIQLSGGVPGKPVLALWGNRPGLAPLFNASLYIQPPVFRLNGHVLDANGATTYSLGLAPALLGVTRDFQFWFRDPLHADGTGAGLSNALQVRFTN
ncbi:MAG TPA: hypothetical protein VM509_15730, partial [Planctomycetota bacterium]|nr:hypothetical protein [Planctomycetota bacterium]